MLRKFVPHITIVICNMYVVFYFIDRVNSAMQFINNSITKALLLVMCILSTVNAALLILDNRRRQEARNRRRPSQPAQSYPQRAERADSRTSYPPRRASSDRYAERPYRSRYE